MDLKWQIDIVDDLISENPDATIADYIQLVDELSLIENNERDNKKPDYYDTYVAAGKRTL